MTVKQTSKCNYMQWSAQQGRLSTIDLLGLTSLDQNFLLKVSLIFNIKQATFMKSTLMSLPLLLGYPGTTYFVTAVIYACKMLMKST